MLWTVRFVCPATAAAAAAIARLPINETSAGRLTIMNAPLMRGEARACEAWYLQ